ncbi:MAG: endonuclease Q family protein [Nanoarchaeota archaeon]
MQIISDLHMHSKYSRATSKDLDIDNLEKWAKIKGLNLLGTSDFTHPEWIKELKTKLTDDGTGIFRTKTGMGFILQTEVSLIYTDMGKGRRVHNVILAPDFDVVDQITEYLKKHGRVDYDGRPIFKIPCPVFVDDLRKISTDIEIIPAHVWTPWFSLFGSMSGFNSVEEAFKDQAKHIHALETGLSSDPAMNWRISSLDKYSLISCSDSHSFWPWRIGREATMFELNELSYKNIINALRTKQGLSGTIEVDPAYGKYHFDGHRTCNVCLNPTESIKLNKICPVCSKPLTIGVEHRIEELADREPGYKPKDAKDFKHLIPLSEIIATLLNCGVATKAVWSEFNKLIKSFDNELNVLLNVNEKQLTNVTDSKIAEAIMKNRNGEIKLTPGYDGVYGKPMFSDKIVSDHEQKQMDLTKF